MDKYDCGDCAVPPGTAHEGGCDVARCMATGLQRLSCDQNHPPMTEADPCGVDVWTGEWPGDAECREFGWWVQDRCAEGLGWVPCAPDAPGATEDVNRLQMEAVWDVEAGRWRKRVGSP